MKTYLTGWLTVLLICACSTGGEEAGPEVVPDATVLTFYVYSPDHPAVTRANTGYVDAVNDEYRVSALQIWVFKTGTNDLIGYVSPNETDRAALNSTGNTMLQMDVSQSFGLSPENVDVYVLANFTLANSGLAFDASTTRDQLEAAMMGKTGPKGVGNSDPFGVTNLVSSVPADGLPMSGVLRNQPVTGQVPVLRIGTSDRLATVQLVRLVSKVRFVFSNSSDSEEMLEIRGITLQGGMIPCDEYVFLTGSYDERSSRVSPDYDAATLSLPEGAISAGEMGRSENPRIYIYKDQSAQDYENLISGGIAQGHLTSRGPYYLRETDKRLAGTITYALDGGEDRQVTFSIAEAGDFSRNHTWIVYAYYYSGFELTLNTAYVNAWSVEDWEPQVYNW